MVLPLYLAMTDTEFQNAHSLPERIAWMACHFSPYGTGLTDLPETLPKGSVLILDDCIPPCRHDMQKISEQLEQCLQDTGAEAVLLDFQRAGNDCCARIAGQLAKKLSFPVGVSELYAKELDCPVFLPPIPPDIPWQTYLTPHSGREIWLEVSCRPITIALTEDGAQIRDGGSIWKNAQRDAELSCRYATKIEQNAAEFTLWRDREDIAVMQSRLDTLGVTRIFGLYQDLCAEENENLPA